MGQNLGLRRLSTNASVALKHPSFLCARDVNNTIGVRPSSDSISQHSIEHNRVSNFRRGYFVQKARGGLRCP